MRLPSAISRPRGREFGVPVATRLPWLIGTMFVMLFSLTAMANYAAAARFGYLLMAVQSEVIVLEKVKRFSLPLMRPPLDMHQQLQATGTHISLIAHITQRELTPNLHPTDVHNGFANRCLWAWVQRSNCLPGGSLSVNELAAVARELRRALDWLPRHQKFSFAAMTRPASFGRIAIPP